MPAVVLTLEALCGRGLASAHASELSSFCRPAVDGYYDRNEEERITKIAELP